MKCKVGREAHKAEVLVLCEEQRWTVRKECVLCDAGGCLVQGFFGLLLVLSELLHIYLEWFTVAACTCPTAHLGWGFTTPLLKMW